MNSTDKRNNFSFLSLGELPNLHIPFHTVFKLTPIAYGELKKNVASFDEIIKSMYFHFDRRFNQRNV